MSAPTLPDICAQTALEAGRSGEKERKLNVYLSVAHLYERRRSARKRSNLRVCRTWTFTRGHKRDATRERGAAFSSQSPKAGHWTPRAKVYVQIPGHLTSTTIYKTLSYTDFRADANPKSFSSSQLHFASI